MLKFKFKFRQQRVKYVMGLDHDTEGVDEVFIAFKCYTFIKVFIYLYSESVMFSLNYINRSVNGF